MADGKSSLSPQPALLAEGHALRLAGQWLSAIAAYEQVISDGVRDADPSIILEALLAVAHARREAGMLAEAEEAYELTIELTQLHADLGVQSRALNGLAIVKQELGDARLAELLYFEAGRLAKAADDQLGQGNIHQNLGTLACIRGDVRSAQQYFEVASACFEAIGNTRGLAGVLNNLGMLYIDTAELAKAKDCLTHALHIAQTAGDLPLLGTVYVNLAELHIELDNISDARAFCDDAYEIASALTDDRIKADALKLSGIILRKAGKVHLAANYLAQAIEVARGRGNSLTAAESLREHAITQRLLGKNRRALENLYDAYAIFQRLHAVQEQSEIDRHLNNIRDDFLAVVAAWGESIEAKDLYTRGHCQRVADYACQLALTIGIPERDIIWFRMGAFLHDVGKTEIPGDLLNKSGELTPDERTIVESHTVRGEALLAEIDFPWDIRPMIRSHHERWDGTGYPDRLRGEEIPLAARILSYADVYDALTTKRSYRLEMTPADALAVMESDVGALDPNMMDAFKDVVRQCTTSTPPAKSAEPPDRKIMLQISNSIARLRSDDDA